MTSSDSEKRLKEIGEEMESLLKRVKALSDEEYMLLHMDDLETLTEAVGRFYIRHSNGTGVFHPTTVRKFDGFVAVGEYVEESLYLIGDFSVYATNSYQVSPEELSRDYEEVTEERYVEEKMRILDRFVRTTQANHTHKAKNE